MMSNQTLIPPAAANPPGVLGLDHRWLGWVVPQMVAPVGCLPSPCWRFRFWLARLVTSKLGLLATLGRRATFVDTRCREITVSAPANWLYPDSE